MIDILFCTHHRVEFAQKALETLIDNTDTREVRLHFYEDRSTDVQVISPGNVLVRENFGGPVAAMNHFLIANDYPDLFVKIDNDVALPPGWLKECLSVMKIFPDLDLLGIEPMDEDPISSADEVLYNGRLRSFRPVEHIGGIGVFRGRAFRKHGLPIAHDRFFGFTKWQTSHDDIVKGWLYPALPVALLDRIPVDPWRRLAREYCAKGWSRPWPPYDLQKRRGQWDWVL